VLSPRPGCKGEVCLGRSNPGLNFINVLSAAFTNVDPKCAKKRQSSQQCHLALLGPMSVKAARKTLVKLTPGSHRRDRRPGTTSI